MQRRGNRYAGGAEPQIRAQKLIHRSEDGDRITGSRLCSACPIRLDRRDQLNPQPCRFKFAIDT